MGEAKRKQLKGQEAEPASTVLDTAGGRVQIR